MPMKVNSVAETTMKSIKEEFSDVLSDKLKDEPMKRPPMKIHLEPDARPINVTTARQTPLKFVDEADNLVEELLKCKVIAKVEKPTTWCSPAFFVPKADGKRVRLVTDFVHLNKFIQRPVHPFPAVKEILQAIPSTARVFAKLDAVQGYFQIALDKESSEYTTFILPSGRYKYLRAPMGLSPSNDEWCRSSDWLIEGLRWCKKIVDDILIWADDYPQLYRRLRTVLKRCREFNVTISLKKMEISNKLHFAGYVVFDGGIKPDPEKIAAISDFPTPRSTTDVRSFLGLAQQLSFFLPDLAQSTPRMRELTGSKAVFRWLHEHQVELDNVKKILTSDMLVKPFDPDLETFLLTDASRLFGIGFALMQREHQGRGHRLIRCGSCSLSDTEKRYSTVELECLAIVYAMKKCSFFLLGTPLWVLTDHRPLVGVFKKDIWDVDNPRLQRMREKVAAFNFTVRYTPGKSHLIADALSRYPVFAAQTEVDMDENPALCRRANEDPALSLIFNAGSADADYKRLAVALLTNDNVQNLPADHPAQAYKGVWNRLSLLDEEDETLVLLDGNRIIVPPAARKGVLKSLHAAHAGVTKSITQASQLYYWPGFINDVKQTVSNCEQCTQTLPSQAKTPLILHQDESTRPMSHLGMDLLDFRGQDYLVMTCRYSGYAFASRLRDTTTRTVLKVMRDWFLEHGWPNVIRSDGGPQFRGEFNNFCQEHGIKHQKSSAYNSESNGLAEAAVKSIKKLLFKTAERGEDFREALQEWRNTPRADGFSPAQMFTGRRQRTKMPTLPAHHEAIDLQAAEAARAEGRVQMKLHHDQHTLPLAPLSEGDRVFVQDPVKGTWNTTATVISTRDSGMSYTIINDKGRTSDRNRKHLRPDKSAHSGELQEEEWPALPAPPATTPASAPRRSERIAKKAEGAAKIATVRFATSSDLCPAPTSGRPSTPGTSITTAHRRTLPTASLIKFSSATTTATTTATWAEWITTTSSATTRAASTSSSFTRQRSRRAPPSSSSSSECWWPSTTASASSSGRATTAAWNVSTRCSSGRRRPPLRSSTSRPLWVVEGSRSRGHLSREEKRHPRPLHHRLSIRRASASPSCSSKNTHKKKM